MVDLFSLTKKIKKWSQIVKNLYYHQICLGFCRKVNTYPFCFDLGQREKINLNFYFHISFWCLKRFYEALKGLHKTFQGTTKKFENKNLS